MIKILKSLYPFLVLFFLFNCKSNAEKVDERKQIVDSVAVLFQQSILKNSIDSIFTKHQFNGSISIKQNEKYLYSHQSGYSDFKTKKKIDSSTVFAIASISKQFTAVLILLKKEEGKLDVNDKVHQYLPEFNRPKFNQITIHHLLTHTSGIYDFGDGLQFEVGSDYGYSNKGYNYLGEIIEKISGKSFDENAKTLFDKVGMKNTFTALSYIRNQLGGANIGTIQNPQKVENMPRRLADQSIGTPAGGILSTASDLHLWNEKLYGGKIINDESLNLLKKNYSTRGHYVLGKVGYGYGVMSNQNEPKAYFHTGYVKGAPSLLIYYPETKTSVAILSNFANESLGKTNFFMPHRQVKDVTDALESSVIDVKKQMLKEAADKE